jgi:hypothetical protein
MADQEKKPKEPKGDFPKAHKEVNYIYGGPNSCESRRKQKLIAREVMVVSPTTPEYVKWLKVSITFDRSDHPDFVPKPGWYPLIVSPIVKDIKLNRVLVLWKINLLENLNFIWKIGSHSEMEILGCDINHPLLLLILGLMSLVTDLLLPCGLDNIRPCLPRHLVL